MKLLVAVISAALFLTACEDKKSTSTKSESVNKELLAGAPMPPTPSAEQMLRIEKRQKRDFCSMEKWGSDENHVSHALACKAKAGLEICLEFFTEAACDALPEN